jgi:predicted DNA-binding transcriptional regulator AlpA
MNTAFEAASLDSLVSKRQLLALVPFGNTTIYYMMLRGEFPSPTDTLRGRRYWRISDIRAWTAGKRSGWPREADEGAAERMAHAARILTSEAREAARRTREGRGGDAVAA